MIPSTIAFGTRFGTRSHDSYFPTKKIPCILVFLVRCIFWRQNTMYYMKGQVEVVPIALKHLVLFETKCLIYANQVLNLFCLIRYFQKKAN